MVDWMALAGGLTLLGCAFWFSRLIAKVRPGQGTALLFFAAQACAGVGAVTILVAIFNLTQ